ncbi:FAD/NAD(P)-binding protein [Chryseobacterium sp. TY4]
MQNIKTIALVGGGPAALFMMKYISEANSGITEVLIFEKNDRLGAGMPYSEKGAKKEHVANVSAKELPKLMDTLPEFISKYPQQDFPDFVKDNTIDENIVVPRLLLGNYLEYEFQKYIGLAKKNGIQVSTYTRTEVLDILPQKPEGYKIISPDDIFFVNIAVICIGHTWIKNFEEHISGWYDSPYPPSKFTDKTNYPVAIRGASLTAVDAIKTLARLNGSFENEGEKLIYNKFEECPDFKINLYSLRGFLPAIRFHTDDEIFSTEWTMTHDEIYDYKKNHGGFVDLDFVYQRNFLLPLRKKDALFYERVKDLSIEDFVSEMLKIRKELDSFLLFKAEYREAEKSYQRQQSVVWKEILSAFSYAVNYPAKHFPAEDMLRLKKTLMPLISIIIASLPQSSYHEMMALYEAGVLTSFAIGMESEVIPSNRGGADYRVVFRDGAAEIHYYQMFVDAVGQRSMQFNDIPFESLKVSGEISPGFLYFKNQNEGKKLFDKGDKSVKQNSNGKYYLMVTGLEINDDFQALDSYGAAHQNLFLMSVPFIGGLNPDYSGLDFCDTAAERIVTKISNN